MALPNPWYIDAEARHYAQQQRLLAYASVEGKEGVLGEEHLAVRALDTPGGAINALPGGYSVLARHTGGQFEAYVGKYVEQETVTVNPTDSSGPRTDLVILRVENPYVVGSGSWSQPPDPMNGPYVYVRVIEGVPAGTTSVSQINPDWSAITLARIDRPSNTGIVEQAHITDLRSLAKLGGERIIIVEPPEDPDEPPPPPPIAHTFFFEIRNYNSNQKLGDKVTPWTDFPNDCRWDVAIPPSATHADVWMVINNIQVREAGVYGELRVSTPFGQTAPTQFDVWHREQVAPFPGYQRHPVVAAGRISIPKADRGTIRRFRSQARLTKADGGELHWVDMTNATLLVVFKTNPS